MMSILLSGWFIALVSLLVGSLGLVYLYLSYKQTYWKRRGVPYVQPKSIFGNFGESTKLKQSFADGIRNLYFQSEKQRFVGTYLLHRPNFMVRDPELIRLFLVKDFAHFHDHTLPVDENVDPLSAKHLFNSRGQKWRDLRVRLTPTFTSGKLKKMMYLITQSGEELGKFLEDRAARKEIFDVKDVLGKFTTDVIAACAFGIQCNSMKDPEAEFRRMGKALFEPTFLNGLRRSIRLLSPALSNLLKLRSFPSHLTDFFRKLVKDTMEYRETNNIVRNDFIDLLMQIKKKGYVEDEEDSKIIEHGGTDAKKNGFKEFSHDDLTAQVLVFFIAGFETSSTTMSFALYELACNPDIQKKLTEEIDKVLAKHKDVTYEAIQEMEYLDLVVNETLRKYPPVPNLTRECTKAYNIPDTDVHLEKGTDVIIPVYGIHYDPKYYPQPEKFLPTRFLEEAKSKRPAYTFLPFGEGPRLCIGMRFGLMQTKVGLVSLLRHYKFKTCSQTPIPMQLDPKSIVLSTKGGLYLQITKRNEE